VAHKGGKSGKRDEPGAEEEVERMPRKIYETELFRLQAELVKLQEWVRTEGARLVVLVEDVILLRKYWFSVSDTEQEHRFHSRLEDPLRRWKLSPMDLESITRWEDYSRAKDEMFVHTDIPEAPWYVVDSADKRRARINMIAHLLSTLTYHDVQPRPLELPRRPASQGYIRAPRESQTFVPDHAGELLAD